MLLFGIKSGFAVTQEKRVTERMLGLPSKWSSSKCSLQPWCFFFNATRFHCIMYLTLLGTKKRYFLHHKEAADIYLCILIASEPFDCFLFMMTALCIRVVPSIYCFSYTLVHQYHVYMHYLCLGGILLLPRAIQVLWISLPIKPDKHVHVIQIDVHC